MNVRLAKLWLRELGEMTSATADATVPPTADSQNCLVTELRLAHQFGFAIARGEFDKVEQIWVQREGVSGRNHSNRRANSSIFTAVQAMGHEFAVDILNYSRGYSHGIRAVVKFDHHLFWQSLREVIVRRIHASEHSHDCRWLETSYFASLISLVSGNFLASLATDDTEDGARGAKTQSDTYVSGRQAVCELRNFGDTIVEMREMLLSSRAQGRDDADKECEAAALMFAAEVASAASEVIYHRREMWRPFSGPAIPTTFQVEREASGRESQLTGPLALAAQLGDIDPNGVPDADNGEMSLRERNFVYGFDRNSVER